MAKKEEVVEQPHLDPTQEYRLNLLKQELKALFTEKEKVNYEIKSNK